MRSDTSVHTLRKQIKSEFYTGSGKMEIYKKYVNLGIDKKKLVQYLNALPGPFFFSRVSRVIRSTLAALVTLQVIFVFYYYLALLKSDPKECIGLFTGTLLVGSFFLIGIVNKLSSIYYIVAGFCGLGILKNIQNILGDSRVFAAFPVEIGFYFLIAALTVGISLYFQRLLSKKPLSIEEYDQRSLETGQSQ